MDASAEAAAWLARLHSRDVPLDVLEEFYRWRRVAANAQAFARAESFWNGAGTLGHDPDIVGATEDALSRSARLSWLQRLRRKLSWPRTIGTSVALCVVATSAALWINRPLHVATGIGEQRIVRLEDGTRVRLNTNTQLTVRLSRYRREIALDRGEAYFQVVHDAARPFVLTAGSLRVSDIGTRFDVRTDETGVSVAVADGQVDVSGGGDEGRGVRLRPGDLLVARAGAPPIRKTADLDQILSWTGGHIVFRDTLLATAIAEMNRYSPYAIEMHSPRLSDTRVNGVFETGNSADFAAAMSNLYSLRVERKPDGSILLSD